MCRYESARDAAFVALGAPISHVLPMRILLIGIVLCVAPSLLAQATVRLHGSTTVQAALEARRTELEAKAGVKLELRAFGSASGLLALASGAADIAMISSPLEDAVRSARKKSDNIDAVQFRAAPIGTIRLAFIINPRNSVRRLNSAQLRGVFSGEIENWSELGGARQPIVVVTLANAGSLVEDKLLGGGKITERARSVPNAAQIPAVVAQDMGAIGIVSLAHARGQTSLVATETEIAVPLLLVTKGEPGATERRVIEAAQALLAHDNS